jgi:hypothetical protein
MELRSLEVMGYQNQPVPTTFIASSNPTGHLGIILPGYRYPVEMAPLHYAGRVLLEQGADVLRVEYAYNQTDFIERPETEQDEWISADVFAACGTGLGQRAYEKITLVGKSLGTIAMGHLLTDERFQNAACIWFTPILTLDWLRSCIEQVHPRSLYIIGTEDQFYQPDILKHLEEVTGGNSLVIDGVDHSLENPDSIHQSLSALHKIIEALQVFFGEGDKI